ncbi:MAG: DHH family phosphoesterase, partial [Kiritimatiellae bacterium]|nr:DHH family phosphoesterase [Kiritimatiellia bacterium]
ERCLQPGVRHVCFLFLIRTMKNQRPTRATRRGLNGLYEVVGEAEPVLVLIHGDPDPDSLASAWALRDLIRVKNRSVTIGYTGQLARPENEAMVRILRIPAAPCTQEVIDAAARIALVDAQPGFFGDVVLPRVDVVIDHHPYRAEREIPFTDVRPHCLATSSILTEYLRQSGVSVGRKLATALFYAIDTDGRNRNTTPSPTDREAISFLIGRVDWGSLRRIEFSSYSLDTLDYFTIALVRLRFSRGILYSNVGPVPGGDVCAQIADFLMRVKEASWAVVCGAVGHRLIIVFRCDGIRKHAGAVAEAAFSKYGSAGGHRTMSRAEIDEFMLPGGIRLTQTAEVDNFVLGSLGEVCHSFRLLLHAKAHG